MPYPQDYAPPPKFQVSLAGALIKNESISYSAHVLIAPTIAPAPRTPKANHGHPTASVTPTPSTDTSPTALGAGVTGADAAGGVGNKPQIIFGRGPPLRSADP